MNDFKGTAMKSLGGSMHGKDLPESVEPSARVLGWVTISPEGQRERYIKRLWMAPDGSRLACMILDSIPRSEVDALATPVLAPERN
ncbi:hypothetical protein [Paraburkholderia caribensis]|uniref:hypothetical protein n=1 Tax=Paraburkholderia caribensis TaxID=75105 RepID=UPI0012E8925F|nr:hypothetical protein [Paraburkholderia caribensis]